MLQETKYFFFLSDLLGKKIKKSTGETIGRVVEIVALNNPVKIYPEITSLVVSPGWFRKYLKISISGVEPFELPIKYLYLKSDAVIEPYSEPGINDNLLLVKDTYLDKQILDTGGCKVVRVNDLHLLKEKNYIWVVHVDIGFRGIARRLGWVWIMDLIMEWIFSYKPNERFVSWKYVRALPPTGERKMDNIALAPSYQCLTNINPADMADILGDINRDERIAMFKLMDISAAADALAELDPKIQKEIFESLDKAHRAQIVLNMPDYKLADMLNELGRKKAEEVIRQLPPEKAEKIKGLLVHPELTAGGLMTTQYLTLNKDLSVDESFVKLRELSGSSADYFFYYIYIVDAEQNLQGVVTLRRLLAAQPTAKLSEVMNSHIVKIKAMTRYKKIVQLSVKYNIDALPVVDAHNKLRGIVLLKAALESSIAV